MSEHLPREWEHLDEDALIAAVDLVGRSGSAGFELSYDDDDPNDVKWSAQAKYRGARIIREGFRDPVAVEALARRLLTGALCRRCGKPISLAGPRKSKSKCRWTRQGARWEPGCGKPIDDSIPLVPEQTGF